MSEDHLTDAELVERALGGSDDAFRALVARHQRPVYNLLVRMLRNPALAEDLAQETFLKVFSRLSTFDPQFKFSNWILRIAHNRAIDAMRRRGPAEVSLDEPDPAEQARMSQILVDPTSDAAPRRAEQHDLARALDKALARLRPEYREVVVLRYHEDLGYEEIARVTGLPQGTVKSYLHRARAEMAAILSRQGWG
ncbi:MAG TPA: sigma-70 family RNA polymerase sigma factor [Vicinamibacterales bacterium]